MLLTALVARGDRDPQVGLPRQWVPASKDQCQLLDFVSQYIDKQAYLTLHCWMTACKEGWDYALPEHPKMVAVLLFLHLGHMLRVRPSSSSFDFPRGWQRQ